MVSPSSAMAGLAFLGDLGGQLVEPAEDLGKLDEPQRVDHHRLANPQVALGAGLVVGVDGDLDPKLHGGPRSLLGQASRTGQRPRPRHTPWRTGGPGHGSAGSRAAPTWTRTPPRSHPRPASPTTTHGRRPNAAAPRP